MIIKLLKKYFKYLQDKKFIKKQNMLEKACVEYFNKHITPVTNIEELRDSIPIGMKGLPLLVKSDSASYPLQAIKAHIYFEEDNIQLSYGDFPYLHKLELIIPIERFPSSLWLSIDEFPRPTCPTLLLCDYGTGHYEVVEYENKTWVTELCFPVKPERYFVLNFLNEDT